MKRELSVISLGLLSFLSPVDVSIVWSARGLRGLTEVESIVSSVRVFDPKAGGPNVEAIAPANLKEQFTPNTDFVTSTCAVSL